MNAVEVGPWNLYFDEVSKFFDTVYIKGWLHRSGSTAAVKLLSAGYDGKPGEAWVVNAKLNEHNPDLMSEATCFEIQGLKLSGTATLPDRLKLEADSGEIIEVPLAKIYKVRASSATQVSCSNAFFRALKRGDRVLDVGGRARSGRRPYMENSPIDLSDVHFTALDIVSDAGVDVVADAHIMSHSFNGQKFDAIISVSVFEHVLMPWKVVLEMNKVLKTGGVVLVHTHQTIGMHDLPWDYWRFSSDCWKGLFNHYTGFEILQTQMSDTMHIVPFWYEDKYKTTEKTAGFESSVVFARKTGEAMVAWDVDLDNIVSDHYPLTLDKNFN